VFSDDQDGNVPPGSNLEMHHTPLHVSVAVQMRQPTCPGVLHGIFHHFKPQEIAVKL
jgi:hypothetical protein